MSNIHNQFSQDTINKYSNYMITSPLKWSEDTFQGSKPVSGYFPIGNNFFGNMECVNNQTGRGFYANPCGYWNNSNKQFYSGATLSNKPELNMNGTLFPIGKISDDIMTNPKNRVVFGYARIGEEVRNR